ncbi:MAG: transcription antitermination protein NusB [Acholeplasmatales bacterium]|nr:transcription antitermination protein NusB [Acholeplasmatales bacterium]
MDLTNRTKSRSKAVEKLYAYHMTGEIDYNETDDYAVELIKGVLEKKEEIDSIISKNLFNYTINRLNLVDLAIVRVATFELLEKKLDKKVIINEAINLTKVYTNLDDDKAKAFNNKLLDNIAKDIASR